MVEVYGRQRGQDHQVHHQEDAADPGLGGVRAPGADVVEPIAVLALSEFAPNGDAAAVLVAALGFALIDLFAVDCK